MVGFETQRTVSLKIVPFIYSTALPPPPPLHLNKILDLYSRWWQSLYKNHLSKVVIYIVPLKEGMCVCLKHHLFTEATFCIFSFRFVTRSHNKLFVHLSGGFNQSNSYNDNHNNNTGIYSIIISAESQMILQ